MTKNIGRPSGNSDARERLLAAARQLFSRLPYDKVSTRAIAREAQLDAALIRYYFANKAGLFEQMLREALAPTLAQLNQLSNQPVPQDMAAVMHAYYGAMARDVLIPRIIFNVLSQGESHPAYAIVGVIFADVAQASQRFINRALVASGRLAPQFDPQLARLSFASLMVFPLVAPQVLIAGFGIDYSQASMNRLVEHNVQVLTQGLLLPEVL